MGAPDRHLGLSRRSSVGLTSEVLDDHFLAVVLDEQSVLEQQPRRAMSKVKPLVLVRLLPPGRVDQRVELNLDPVGS